LNRETASVSSVTIANLATAITHLHFCFRPRFRGKFAGIGEVRDRCGFKSRTNKNPADWEPVIDERDKIASMPRFADTAWGPDWEGRLLRDLADECIEQANNEEQASQPKPTPDDYMITKEVCAKLRVTERTLYRYVKSRKLTVHKIDGKLLFKREDVDRFLDKRKRRAH
jgi:excisionase family DNA binding protein